MIDQSLELKDLAAALAKAQAAVRVAKRDADNPFFKSTYADLASVWEACREALTSNGLSVVQFPGFADGVATLDTILLHSSGQWLKATASAPISKQDPQGVGSALTYLRRYALAAVASVSPADDDGNAASGKKAERGGTTTASTAKRDAAPAKVAPMPPIPTESLTDRPLAIVAEEKAPPPWSAQARTWKGKALGEMSSEDLLVLRKFGVKKGAEQFPYLIEQVDEVLASREGE